MEIVDGRSAPQPATGSDLGKKASPKEVSICLTCRPKTEAVNRWRLADIINLLINC